MIGIFGFFITVTCIFFKKEVYPKLINGDNFVVELVGEIVLMIFALVFGFLLVRFVYVEFFSERQSFHNTELLNVPKLKHLLQNGRKSLATVRDVQYRAKSENQYPEFVLQYAFNPPDDSAPDDLIHEIVVPYDPALRPGDVLPILYTVSEDSTKVMSMPFPFPTKALPELSSCYCKTRNGVIQSS